MTAAVPADEVTAVLEGKAEILFKKGAVFYNKVQELNRDLTVTAITCFARHHHLTEPKLLRRAEREGGGGVPGVRILEALGATGLRSVRFSREIPGELVSGITCNDMSEEAVEAMRRNIEHNGCGNITPSLGDACMLMMKEKGGFDVVDIDPYGTPAPFLDTAVQAVRPGGLLCVTATDLSVLAGNHIQACYGKYGGMPLKRVYCHEFALRLLLSCVDTHANRYSRYIEPLFSYKSDFYVRVFVRVLQSQREVQRTTSRRSYVYDCVGCKSFHLQKLGTHTAGTQQEAPGRGPPVGRTCEECGKEFYIGGPIWSDPMHSSVFLDQMLQHVRGEGGYLGTVKRMEGLLTLAAEELPHTPLYYELSTLSKTLHTTCPPLQAFRSAVLNAGYQVSLSHACPKSVKTNAPPLVIWDIMRAWARQNSVRVREDDPVQRAIMAKEPVIAVDFSLHEGAALKVGVIRFPPNPEPNWGPKARAGKRSRGENTDEVNQKKQKKKKKDRPHNPDLKQFPCRRFEEGQCDLGEGCRYSHPGKEEGRGQTQEVEVQIQTPEEEGQIGS